MPAMRSRSRSAVVVGSGPNGLVAAVVLARSGIDVTVIESADEIGGGTRSAELTLPGLMHDICSAIHPLGIASPILRSLPLDAHGLRWRHPPLDLAHPLDDGTAAVLHRSVSDTDHRLDAAGRWQRLVGPVVDRFPDLVTSALGPLARVPRHPITLSRFGLRAAAPASVICRYLRSPHAAALFAGSAAHLVDRLDRPLSSAPGLLLTAAGHASGWPVAEGGSQAIATALASLLVSEGGTIETGRTVIDLADLPADAAVFLDTAPGAAADIIGEQLPSRVEASYRRWQHGPGSFKLDLAVDGGVPWSADACHDAGTVHIGGTATEIIDAENSIASGRMVERPFVLVAQQDAADPGRRSGSVRPVWAYCHVPRGFDDDASEAILAQIERFAPGFRSRIVGSRASTPRDLEAHNANYVGGDIAAGRSGGHQMIIRPRPAINPYSTGVDGVYLCSAATPPGAGVHGMCGFHAARSWLASR